MIEVQTYNEDLEPWDAYVQCSRQGSFFHRIGWKRVIQRTFGYDPLYLVARKGSTICGCLPLFHVTSVFFGHTLISVPFGVTGGICADDPEAFQRLLERSSHFARELGVDYVEFRHAEPTAADLPIKNLYVTFEREIFPSLEQNMEAIPRKQRRMIRQGIKHGLTSVIGGSEELMDFYEIYAHSVRNLGTPVFPYSYFRNIMEEFGEECRILSVLHQGKKVAAVMTFFYKGRVMPYYGGALKSYLPLAVNDFMYWELMRYGCEKGYAVFDFGRSKLGTGAYDFKRHWGFEPKALPYQYDLVRSKAVPDMSPMNTKFKVFIAMWKRLPLSVTKLLGPHLIKYFP